MEKVTGQISISNEILLDLLAKYHNDECFNNFKIAEANLVINENNESWTEFKLENK